MLITAIFSVKKDFFRMNKGHFINSLQNLGGTCRCIPSSFKSEEAGNLSTTKTSPYCPKQAYYDKLDDENPVLNAHSLCSAVPGSIITRSTVH